MLAPLMPVVRVEHTTADVAILLAEYAASEQQVVNDQEKHAPPQEWPIQALDAVNYKGAVVVKVFCVEKVAGAQKEYGHMKYVNKVRQPTTDASMRQHHTYNGYGLDYGKLG